MGWTPNGDLHTLYRSLSPARRKQLLVVALLMPVTAVAEMLMIAAIVPMLSALVPGGGPESVLAGPLARLERLWPTQAMVAAATLFIPVVIVTSILRLVLTRKSLSFSADLGHDLNMEIQRRMLHQPYLFHVSSHSSRLLASLEKIDEMVLGYVLRGLQFLSALVIAVALVAALVLVDARSAAIHPVRSTSMSGSVRQLTAAAVAIALCVAPTGAIAAKPVGAAAAPAATSAASPTTNPWLTLSAMTSSSTAASSAAAAQGYEDDGTGFPPLPVLAVILATIGVAIYIAVSDDDDDDGIGIPISP